MARTTTDDADVVIRSNSTTAMNEAVALELLSLTGLATQEAIATDSPSTAVATELRLASSIPTTLEEPNTSTSDESALYKADSTGDYSYRGDDPDAYDEVFDQKAGRRRPRTADRVPRLHQQQ